MPLLRILLIALAVTVIWKFHGKKGKWFQLYKGETPQGSCRNKYRQIHKGETPQGSCRNKYRQIHKGETPQGSCRNNIVKFTAKYL